MQTQRRGIACAGLVAILAVGTAGPSVSGQDSARDEAVRGHVRALERAHEDSLDALLSRFERDHLSAAFLAVTPADERRRLFGTIRDAAADAGGVLVDVRDGRYILTLAGTDTYDVAFTVDDSPPFAITSLDVSTAPSPDDGLVLTRDNLAETFDRLAADGWSGVVHVRLDDDLVIERAFGAANATLAAPVSLDTIFGVGSQPIDLTTTAVLLLEARGTWQLDDTIDAFLEDVPDDKRAITLRHLLTGRSGLPDFFHTPEDADPDLSWIDRAEAERRLLAQALRFEPGTSQAHSHGAFVLLAALVERASGMSYPAFVRQHILEPAGMTRTGFYGESLGLPLTEFAVGGGPSRVGVPNIPPNWGPTSWLIMGSGGMFSTLNDLARFYQFVRSGAMPGDAIAAHFDRPSVSVDGSDRGFELFRAWRAPATEAMLLLNMPAGAEVRAVFQALRLLVEEA